MKKETPSNWTDFLYEEHKENEIPNSLLNSLTKVINEKVLDFTDYDNIKYYLRLYLSKYSNTIKKLAISKFGNESFLEILICTKISKRLFRIKNESLDSIYLNEESKTCLGDSDYFSCFSNQFIFIDLKN